MDKKSIILDFLNAALGDPGDFDLGRYFTEEATFCGPVTGGKIIPMMEWVEFKLVVQGLVGPSSFEVMNAIEQDDWISMRIRISAKCLSTAEMIVAYDCLMARFEGDRIAEYIGHMDYFTFFQDLGLIPPGSLHACLSGQRMVWE